MTDNCYSSVGYPRKVTRKSKVILKESQKKKTKELLGALLICSYAIHGFLQDLDVGDVVLAQ